MQRNPPLQQLVSFRCLDSYLDLSKNSPQFFCELFAKKQKMIQFVQQKKLVAKSYKGLLIKKYKETANDDIKSLIQMDLLSLKDINQNDVEAWFQDCINQTGDCYEQQKNIYQKYNNSPTSKKQSLAKKTQDKMTKSEQKQKQQNSEFSSQEVINFRGLDSFMEQYQQNREIFAKLFQKKQKMLRLVNDKKLIPAVYKKMLQTKLVQIKNPETRSLTQMELDNLQDLHDGNIQQWFKQILSETEQVFNQQRNILKGVKNSKVSKNMPQIQIGSIIDQKNENFAIKSVKKSQIKNVKQSEINSNVGKESVTKLSGQFISFKQLDDLLDKSKADATKFIQFFEKKREMFQDIKNSKLTPQLYHSLLQNQFQKCTNEDLKFSLQMQLSDLNDLCDGDKAKWFEQLINETGDFYEQQENIYKIHKNPMNKTFNRKSAVHQQLLDPNSSIRASTRIRIQDRVEPSDEKYLVNQIVSFTALSELLSKHYEQDKDYFIKLEEKKTKLLKLVSNHQLQPQQYKALLIRTLTKIKTPYLVYMMKQQLRSLDDQFASNEDAWFLYLIKRLKQSNRPSGRVSVPISKIGGMRQLTDAQLLQANPKTKVEYLLRRIAQYQAVLAFFKNNDLQQQAYNFVKIYYLPLKNEVMGYKDQLQKGKPEQIQKLDVVQFRKKKIGTIDFQKFHAGVDKTAYENKLIQRIKIIKEAQAQYRKYQAGIKKATNLKNKEQAKKRMQEADQDINYINSLKNKQFVVPPKVDILKVDKFNMDFHKLENNEMEISVHNISGLSGETLLKIYICQKKEKLSKWVRDGDPKIVLKCKIDEKQMQEIIKGTDEKVIIFKLFQKGWFGSQKLVAEQGVCLNFVKINTFDEKVMLKQGEVQINFTAKVQKPKKPIVTVINDYVITKYPEYKFDNRIQEQFLKKHMPYVNPTQSEIHA